MTPRAHVRRVVQESLSSWIKSKIEYFLRSRGAVILAMAMIAAQLIVAVSYAVVARGATPAEFGNALGLIALSSLASGLFDFGLSNYMVREIAASVVTTHEAATRIARRLIVALTLAALILVVAILLEISLGLDLLGISAALLLVFIATALAQSAQVPARAQGQMSLLSAATVANRLAGLATVLVATNIHLPVIWVLASAISFGQVVNALVSVFGVRGRRSSAKIGRTIRAVGGPHRWSTSWVGAGSYGMAGVAGAAQQVDVSLLTVFGGSSAAGFYGAVSRWTQPLVLPATALSQAIVGRVSAAGSARESFQIVLDHAWMIVLGIAASIMFAFFAGPLTEVVLGPKYSQAALALAVLALAAIPTLLGQPLAMVLQSRRHDSVVATAMWIALAVRLILVCVFGAFFGAIGAALAVFTQQTVMLGIVLVVCLKLWHQERGAK